MKTHLPFRISPELRKELDDILVHTNDINITSLNRSQMVQSALETFVHCAKELRDMAQEQQVPTHQLIVNLIKHHPHVKRRKTGKAGGSPPQPHPSTA